MISSFSENELNADRVTAPEKVDDMLSETKIRAAARQFGNPTTTIHLICVCLVEKVAGLV